MTASLPGFLSDPADTLKLVLKYGGDFSLTVKGERWCRQGRSSSRCRQAPNTWWSGLEIRSLSSPQGVASLLQKETYYKRKIILWAVVIVQLYKVYICIFIYYIYYDRSFWFGRSMTDIRYIFYVCIAELITSSLVAYEKTFTWN